MCGDKPKDSQLSQKRHENVTGFSLYEALPLFCP
jgi:hypothetical protein